MCLENDLISNCPGDEQAWELFGKMEETAKLFGDMSFAAFCTRVNATASQRPRLLSYVEGFNAADADTIGIAGLARQQRAEDAIEGDRAARLIGGYHALARYLQRQAVAARAELLLNTPVTAVRRHSGRCEVHAADGRSWTALRVVCALPLGVLQARAVRFDPLPRDITHAIDALSAGTVKRLVLRFQEPLVGHQPPRPALSLHAAAHAVHLVDSLSFARSTADRVGRRPSGFSRTCFRNRAGDRHSRKNLRALPQARARLLALS